MKTPFWFLKKNIVALVLTPASLIYFIFAKSVYIYRLFRQKMSKRPGNSVPVICVGNIMAGGVGKTPIVREIAGFLANSAIVMRGYGAANSHKNSNLRVRATDFAMDVGDEPKMLSDCGFSVFVGKDRVLSLKMAEKAGFSYIVMDDGFQNPSVKKSVSLLVFDEKIGVGNGFMLPAGPLREPLRCGLRRADAIIVISDTLDNNALCLMPYALKKPVFLAKKDTINPGLFGKVVAFSGIGYPDKFFDSVRGMNKVRVIETVSFPDHYEYKRQDFINLFKLAKKHGAELVCTEKDWVKFPENIKKKIKYAPLVVKIEPDFYDWLADKVKEVK